MNTIVKELPQKTSLAPLFGMLPLALSQAYVIWLVATGVLGYMQVLLITAAELWLILAISGIFFSPTLSIFGKRISQLFFGTLALAVILFISSLGAVSQSLQVGTHEQPLFRMIGVFKFIFTAEVFKNGLIYLAVMLGTSLLLSAVNRPAQRYWFNNVIRTYGATLLALGVTMFAAFFLADPKGPNIVSATLTVCVLSGLRVFLAWFFVYRASPEYNDDAFRKFTAGEV